MTLASLGVFAAGQSACLLRSDLTALGVSLVVCGVLGAGTLALGWPTAPLPLFALLLAIHTMMPVSRIVSLVLAILLTVAHLALAISWRPEVDNTTAFYSQVSPHYLACTGHTADCGSINDMSLFIKCLQNLSFHSLTEKSILAITSFYQLLAFPSILSKVCSQ